MLEYEIKEGKNLKEDIMIKNSSRVDFSLPEKMDCRILTSFGLAMTKVDNTPLVKAACAQRAQRSRQMSLAVETRLTRANKSGGKRSGDCLLNENPSTANAVPLPLTREVKRCAFALAEVLITLGIIGIVAAMTMPALVQHYKKVEYSSRLKKFYSVMNQAILASELDNGPAGDWQKVGGISGDIKNEEDEYDYEANSSVTQNYINTYLKPYIKITDFKILKKGDPGSTMGQAVMTFADGSYVIVHNGNCVDFSYDVNGPKLPNERGRDIFHFYLCSNQKCVVNPWLAGYCGKFIPIGSAVGARTTELENCKSSPDSCVRLLYIDNFEFKDDYPIKL
ncbi:type II secretion system protein [bacterium]|nr:type II secretion system protein [bacterium]